jgi:hypothetical protein
MRIVEGRGNRRQITELPHLKIRAQDPKAHEMLIVNLQERICGASFALQRKGFRIYAN